MHVRRVYLVDDLCFGEDELLKIFEEFKRARGVSCFEVLYYPFDEWDPIKESKIPYGSAVAYSSDMLDVFPLLEVKSKVTLKDIVDGTKEFDRISRSDRIMSSQHTVIDWKEEKVFIGMKSYMIRTVAYIPEGAGTHAYSQILYFTNMDVSDTETKETPFETDDGYYVGYIYYDKTPVYLRCACPDFKYRWAEILYRYGALFGKLPRYDKEKEVYLREREKVAREVGVSPYLRLPHKLYPEIRRRVKELLLKSKPRAVQKPAKPGACKHIMAVVDALVRAGRVK